MTEKNHYFFKALMAFAVFEYVNFAMQYFRIQLNVNGYYDLLRTDQYYLQTQYIFFFMGLIIPIIYIVLGIYDITKARKST